VVSLNHTRDSQVALTVTCPRHQIFYPVVKLLANINQTLKQNILILFHQKIAGFSYVYKKIML